MFCHKCGTQLPEGAGFCHKCGTKVVHDSTEQQVSDTSHGNHPNVWESFRKPAKIISWILVPVVILVLITSGALKDAFDALVDFNEEMEARITGASRVPDMQSADDIFSSGSEEVNDNSSESSFAWVEEAHMVTEDDFFKTRYIVDAIKNISDTTFESASVEFILYDSNGNQIDTTADYISNFRAGNTWKFKAIVLSDDVAYFEFLHATKTYPRK